MSKKLIIPPSIPLECITHLHFHNNDILFMIMGVLLVYNWDFNADKSINLHNQVV